MIKTTNEHIKLMEDIHKNVCKEFGYTPVDISLNKRLKSAAGRCIKHDDGLNTIDINQNFMENQKWDIDILTALIKHETIHLKHFNHSIHFKNECRRLGITPHLRDMFDLIPRNDFKWTAVCPKCGHKFEKMREPKHNDHMSCGYCTKVFDSQAVLNYKKNR